MTDTVTLSRADLDALVKQAAAGGTPAAQLAAPVTEPEPDLTIGDVLRTLVHYARLPVEELQRKCLAAIDKEYAVTAESADETVTADSATEGKSASE